MRVHLAALCRAATVCGAGAHPHDAVDPRALVSVEPNGLALEIVILPSVEDGAGILAHLDDAAEVPAMQRSADGGRVVLHLPKS